MGGARQQLLLRGSCAAAVCKCGPAGARRGWGRRVRAQGRGGGRGAAAAAARRRRAVPRRGRCLHAGRGGRARAVARLCDGERERGVPCCSGGQRARRHSRARRCCGAVGDERAAARGGRHGGGGVACADERASGAVARRGLCGCGADSAWCALLAGCPRPEPPTARDWRAGGRWRGRG